MKRCEFRCKCIYASDVNGVSLTVRKSSSWLRRQLNSPINMLDKNKKNPEISTAGKKRTERIGVNITS